MSGHPDDQAYASWRGPSIAALSAFPLSAGNQFSAQTYVTNYASLVISVGPAGSAGCSVSVAFYQDSTLGTTLGSYAWTVSAGQALPVVVPILGNYLVFTVTSTSGPAQNTRILCTQSNMPVSSPRYVPGICVIQSNGLSVLAGTTVIIPLPYIAQGPASMWVSDDANTGLIQARFVALSLTGTEIGVWQRQNTVTTGNEFNFTCPGIPMGLVLFNSSGAINVTVKYSVIVDGR